MTPLDTMPLAARARTESLGPGSPSLPRSRTHSVSSDRPSLTGFGGLLSPPIGTNPEAIYIAASAASQIVTNDHDSHSESWFDQHGIEPSGETALVAPGALKLVNHFLDQLLFNFLSLSRSTSLASLRPAVSEVLKPKLAKDAIGLADGELQEYLGGGEDEELLAFHNGLEPSGDWDLELVWKRTRLRCMVYSSLGDMEEEDEDHYTELEQLDGPPGSNNRFSNNPGVVSPAVAIFLTSILEFMGEQVLVVAGQAAYHRLRAKHEKEERDGTSSHGDIADRVVVEDMDMERVALDRTLGRLWRGWKKRIRSPTPSMSMARSFSRESMGSRGHSRMNSIANEAIVPVDDVLRKASIAESIAYDNPATIPLPMNENDVREIETPWLAYQSDDESEEQTDDEHMGHSRPKSMFIPRDAREPLTPLSVLPPSAAVLSPSSRKRSNSLPSPPISSSFSAPNKSYAAPVDVANAESMESRLDSKAVDVSQHQEIDESAKKSLGDEGSSEPEQKVSVQRGSQSSKGKITGIIASAAAMGAVAVAGITAVAKGGAPETVHTPGEESDLEEGFIEEPQIMTSSRVSLHGGISADQNPTASRPGSVRSPSVHSLRLVEVSSLRSPARSRHGSVGSLDQMASVRPTTVSRSGSLHSHIAAENHVPRGTSPIPRSGTGSPIVRNGSAMSMRQARNSASDSISELEEQQITPPRSVPSPAVIPERSPLRESRPQLPAPKAQDKEKSSIAPSTYTSGEKGFNLADPPLSGSSRGTSIGQNKVISNPSAGTLASPAMRTPDTGVPPLTPLREMMEGAQDTSDEASSVAPSHRARSEVNVPSPSVSGSKFANNHQYSEASRTPEKIKSIRVDAVERARVSPSQVPREDDTAVKTGRKIHTSSSNSSSGSHKLRPMRTSEESVPMAGEDKGRSFEQLIQSDQTIQYTLTPQNMREIESPGSPHATFPPGVYTKGGDRPRTSSSASKSAALGSNPPVLVDAKGSRIIPRPMANSGAKVRSGVPQARDARVDRDSIGDFAEFIRSTGPPGVSFDDASPRPAPAVNVHRGQNGSLRNTSASSPRVAALNGAPRRSQSSATRRLQAREAVVPFGDSSSDLIDFIRQGPPSEKTHENPRIPRTVAPFRTTMDSDQMSGAVGGRVSELAVSEPRHSQGSTNPSNGHSLRSVGSVQSSVTSQSALLNSYNPKKPSTTSSFNKFGDDDMMPKRKTRRVKDPYAIDFSDEEDGYETPQAKPARQEESLADFLNNAKPPPPSPPPSAFELVSKPVSKKASAPSLMARFSRNSNSHSKAAPANSATQSSSRAGNSASHAKSSMSTSSTSSPASGKRTSSVSTSNYVSRLDSERKPTRTQQSSFQARDAVGARSPARTATSDLADFLMNTPPPPSNGPQRLSVVPEPKEEGGFARMFGRRKKAAAA